MTVQPPTTSHSLQQFKFSGRHQEITLRHREIELKKAELEFKQYKNKLERQLETEKTVEVERKKAQLEAKRKDAKNTHIHRVPSAHTVEDWRSHDVEEIVVEFILFVVGTALCLLMVVPLL